MSSDENDKRAEPRYAIGAQVRVMVPGWPAPKLHQASDISVHGIFIEMSEPPAVGTEVIVGPDDVALHGRVVFALTSVEATTAGREPGVGVRLDREIDPDGFLLLCAEENAAARSSTSLSVDDVEAALLATFGDEESLEEVDDFFALADGLSATPLGTAPTADVPAKPAAAETSAGSATAPTAASTSAQLAAPGATATSHALAADGSTTGAKTASTGASAISAKPAAAEPSARSALAPKVASSTSVHPVAPGATATASALVADASATGATTAGARVPAAGATPTPRASALVAGASATGAKTNASAGGSADAPARSAAAETSAGSAAARNTASAILPSTSARPPLAGATPTARTSAPASDASATGAKTASVDVRAKSAAETSAGSATAPKAASTSALATSARPPVAGATPTGRASSLAADGSATAPKASHTSAPSAGATPTARTSARVADASATAAPTMRAGPGSPNVGAAPTPPTAAASDPQTDATSQPSPFAEHGAAWAKWNTETKAADRAGGAETAPASNAGATALDQRAPDDAFDVSIDDVDAPHDDGESLFRAPMAAIRPAPSASPTALAVAARSARRTRLAVEVKVKDAVIVDGVAGQAAFVQALTEAGFKTFVAVHGLEGFVLCLRRRPLLCILPAEDRLLPGRLLIADLRRRPELNGTAFALFDRSAAPNPSAARVAVFRVVPDVEQARRVVDALGEDRAERSRGLEDARALANEVADLSRRLADLGAPELAISGMRYASLVAPTVSAHKLSLARLLLSSPDGRQRDEGGAIVEGVLRQEPRAPSAHVMRAYAFDARGRKEEARLALRRALQLEEAHEEANAAMQKLEQGERLVVIRSGTSVPAPSERGSSQKSGRGTP